MNLFCHRTDAEPETGEGAAPACVATVEGQAVRAVLRTAPVVAVRACVEERTIVAVAIARGGQEN